jgi:hypothetical protein
MILKLKQDMLAFVGGVICCRSGLVSSAVFYICIGISCITSNVIAQPLATEEIKLQASESPSQRKADQKTIAIPSEVVEKSNSNLSLMQHSLLFISAILLAIVGGVAQVLKKFHRFIGLGILTNIYTLFLLVIISSSTAFTYIWVFLSEGIIFGYQFSVTTASALGCFGSPIAGNLTTLLGRLAGASNMDTSSIDQAKEMAKAKSSNILLELIRDKIGNRMDMEVVKLTRQYDWDLIKQTTSRLIETEITLKRLKPGDGDEARNFILDFIPSSDINEDHNNKYMALHRAIHVSSFRQLKKRLANGQLNIA